MSDFIERNQHEEPFAEVRMGDDQFGRVHRQVVVEKNVNVDDAVVIDVSGAFGGSPHGFFNLLRNP